MRRNLLDVFNEPDPARRAAAIAETYAEDVVWHEPDRIMHGRKIIELHPSARTQISVAVVNLEGAAAVR